MHITMYLDTASSCLHNMDIRIQNELVKRCLIGVPNHQQMITITDIMGFSCSYGQFNLYTNILIGKRRVEDSSMYNFSFMSFIKKKPASILT